MNNPSGIITLTTDFGYDDPFVGVMKGKILGRKPDCQIVDLTHGIHAHWPVEAGFWLQKSYRYFPQGTIHIAVVDPGVGTARAILIAEADGHVFLAPDNGLLAQTLRTSNDSVVYRLSQEWLNQQGWPQASFTFHGRDIFAPLAAEFAASGTAPADVGQQTTDYSPCPLEQPTLADNMVHGTVITIDHFGNLITDIEESTLGKLKNPIALTGGKSFRFQNTYGRCKSGDYLALINSFGVVEISRSQGNAAEGLGLGRGTPVTVRETAAGH
jgi:S-adenosylmethionine hydrolase